MDYSLEGPKWGGGALGTPGGVVTWAIDATVSATFVSYISAAFADWAHYANITFQQVASTASAQIDFTLGYIDGLNSTLGTASYSYFPGRMTAAQITFDSAENWHMSGNKLVSDGGANFFVVALHEIGHALGLDHYTATPAVMNPAISLAIVDLTTSDIHGIQALYGPAPPPAPTQSVNLFGDIIHDVNSSGGKIYALYDAILDREPDVLGLEHTVYVLEHGMSLSAIANILINSGEGQSHLAAGSNQEFVSRLYQTALHRNGEAAGINGWVDALNHGTSRGDVAIAFALSAENVAGFQSKLNAGIFVPDQNAADVARLYYGILGRAPEANGLDGWTKSLEAGASLKSTIDAFLASQEFTDAHRGQTDAQFVDSLYQSALGRHAEASGLDGWVGALSHGTSRSDVALAIAESNEAQVHLAPLIEQGWIVA